MPISSRFGNAISFCISSTDRSRSRRLNFCHTAPNDSGDAEGFDIMGLIFSVTTYPPSSLSLDCWWYTHSSVPGFDRPESHFVPKPVFGDFSLPFGFFNIKYTLYSMTSKPCIKKAMEFVLGETL